MRADTTTINYREYQLSKLRSLGSLSIQLKASGGEVHTHNLGIDKDELTAIEGILLHEYKPTQLEDMEAYELFMHLQMWSIENLRQLLQKYDLNGQYVDDIANGFVLTREYAINTIFKFLILDNQ